MGEVIRREARVAPNRCDFCGRFMTWERFSSWNCFAGFSKAWCDRLDCGRRADREAVTGRAA